MLSYIEVTCNNIVSNSVVEVNWRIGGANWNWFIDNTSLSRRDSTRRRDRNPINYIKIYKKTDSSDEVSKRDISVFS